MKSVVRLLCVVALAAVAARVLVAQQVFIPIEPAKQFGSGVTPSYEGWFNNPDGTKTFLIGYLNRNRSQEVDVPIGPNNHIDPGGPDMGQPTHFGTGRGWGVFSIPIPKDFGEKKLTWTIVANGFTNAITLHTKADYIVEPLEDPANKNTPPKLRFKESGEPVIGPPKGVAEKYAATVGAPLAITVWASDEGPKINVPETTGRGRRGRGAAGGDAAGRGAGRGGRGGDAAAIPAEFQPAPPLALTWSKFRGPGDVKFDSAKPKMEIDGGEKPAGSISGKATVNVTFAAPGDYVLRVEGNDSTGAGGGGFQCCWTSAHVGVTVK